MMVNDATILVILVGMEIINYDENQGGRGNSEA